MSTEQEFVALPCRVTPKGRGHRWSEWHRVQEWNEVGQQLTIRLCVNHMQTQREWRASEPAFVE